MSMRCAYYLNTIRLGWYAIDHIGPSKDDSHCALRTISISHCYSVVNRPGCTIYVDNWKSANWSINAWITGRPVPHANENIFIKKSSCCKDSIVNSTCYSVLDMRWHRKFVLSKESGNHRFFRLTKWNYLLQFAIDPMPIAILKSHTSSTFFIGLIYDYHVWTTPVHRELVRCDLFNKWSPQPNLILKRFEISFLLRSIISRPLGCEIRMLILDYYYCLLSAAWIVQAPDSTNIVHRICCFIFHVISFLQQFQCMVRVLSGCWV